MDYVPLRSPVEADESLFDAPPGSSWTRLPSRQRAENTLRYRGLELDLTTGGAYLNDRPVRLTTGERDLLLALMRHAGQIISPAQLAAQVDCAIAELESLVDSLAESLAEAGAAVLPHRVEGLGYVLWR
jgi:DNA-binding response OmpR family regulator